MEGDKAKGRCDQQLCRNMWPKLVNCCDRYWDIDLVLKDWDALAGSLKISYSSNKRDTKRYNLVRTLFSLSSSLSSGSIKCRGLEATNSTGDALAGFLKGYIPVKKGPQECPNRLDALSLLSFSSIGEMS